MKFSFILSLTMLFLVALASCAPLVASSPGSPGLELGQLWSLQTYVNQAGEQVPVLPGSEITLKFEKGKLGGNSGCNSYFGSYQVSGRGNPERCGGIPDASPSARIPGKLPPALQGAPQWATVRA